MAPHTVSEYYSAIGQQYLCDDSQSIKEFSTYLNNYDLLSINKSARTIVTAIRRKTKQQTVTEAFLHEYQLNSQEGIILMGMAEALLRIPDAATQDLLIREKLTSAKWHKHLNHSPSFLVNCATQALAFSGRFEQEGLPTVTEWLSIFNNLTIRLGRPLIHAAINKAMRLLAYRFILAQSMDSALNYCQRHKNYLYSFDRLGEAALTTIDAARYYQDYLDAIEQLSQQSNGTHLMRNPNISVKLSALYPRYELNHYHRAITSLTQQLLTLANKAQQAQITLTIDAEESERLMMSLAIFSNVFNHPDLKDYEGLGLAVQAYQKRSIAVIHWLSALAQHRHKIIPIRLVKGAYWDYEIKQAQQQGLVDYPVFTEKIMTDCSYLACAQLILSQPNVFYPQFATHNAHTIAAIYSLAKNHTHYEFQRLYGMGEQLYDEIMTVKRWPVPCRIYAPVGSYKDLLPYLVRRLLENGANTSFISLLENPEIPIDDAIADPISKLKAQPFPFKAKLIRPPKLFGKKRKNSHGLNLNDIDVINTIQLQLKTIAKTQLTAAPLINGQYYSGPNKTILNPADSNDTVGLVTYSNSLAITAALNYASDACFQWQKVAIKKKAKYLLNAAKLLEKYRIELVSICIREGGRTVVDALNEVREAVDFCHYYAQIATEKLSHPIILPGPTGEQNSLAQTGRGIFICISPWNFPIAIFIGQITAALIAGNTVIAKPTQLTSLTAMKCINILHEAGIPVSVLHFLPGPGHSIGQQLLTDKRIAGVAFTGSSETAQKINQQLAKHHKKIIPLIAETGGQNVMIVDSSALPEQVTRDAITSAFNSAGQRCSALRVLFIQENIADTLIALLIGAMKTLTLGNPRCFQTDIGPVITSQAYLQLSDHIKSIQTQATLLYQVPVSDQLTKGHYFGPCLVEITSLKQLEKEVFGPVLHIVRYHPKQLNQVIADINATGYGLTLGIHSRIESFIDQIKQQTHVGNIYINRNMIGAVVGVQPFGGMGLSGTGPKSGGPNYLTRFAIEKTFSINASAIGGNIDLLTQK